MTLTESTTIFYSVCYELNRGGDGQTLRDTLTDIQNESSHKTLLNEMMIYVEERALQATAFNHKFRTLATVKYSKQR